MSGARRLFVDDVKKGSGDAHLSTDYDKETRGGAGEIGNGNISGSLNRIPAEVLTQFKKISNLTQLDHITLDNG